MSSPNEAVRSILDDLVWDRISRFWSQDLDPNDKDALAGLYNAYLSSMEGDYVRLAQLRDAKSLSTCPIFTQRRWLRLDLNRYAELRGWLTFLAGGLNALTTGAVVAPSGADQTQIYEPPAKPIRHWHIHFPFTIDGSIPDPERRTVQMSYPISLPMTEIFTSSGLRLLPGRDFTILPDGTSFRITTAPAGALFECSIAIDVSSAIYNDVRPVVYQVTTMLGTGIASIPPVMNTGHPVHGLVVRNAPPGSSIGMVQTNNVYFTTVREFYPNLTRGVAGQVFLPSGVSIGPNDILYLFSTEQGSFDTLHQHERMHLVLYDEMVSSFSLPSVILPGLFGSIDSFGSEIKLLFDGVMLMPTEYRYDAITNTVTLATPRAGGTVDVLYAVESRVDPERLPLLHLHFNAVLQSAKPVQDYERFDDGGVFDDLDDPNPFFDTLQSSNIIYLNATIEASNVRVYVDGILKLNGVDFTVTILDDGRTSIGFSFNVDGKAILVDFVKTSALYIYGGIDFYTTIVGGGASYGFTSETLGNVLTDLQGLLATFQDSLGSTIQSVAGLIEAANVAAGSGNPLLTLFYDEALEYQALPVDVEGAPLTAKQARAIESADTQMIALPFLVDHVKNPTRRLQEGVDYWVKDGAIESTVDLTGVWWCPLVVLDEKLLAKNFGSLLGDVRASSLAYRDSLAAQMQLRYLGATPDNIARSAAIILGSPAFTQDSHITSIDTKVVEYAITCTSSSGDLQQTVTLPVTAALPVRGQAVVAGQSIQGKLVFDGSVSSLVSWTGRTLTVQNAMMEAKAGDLIKVAMFTPEGVMIWRKFILRSVNTRPYGSGIYTTIEFDQATLLEIRTDSTAQIIRNSGAPYAAFDGYVSDVQTTTVQVIQTEFEQFSIPGDAVVMFKTGDAIYRGDAVRPDLATLCTDISTPDWHRTKPSPTVPTQDTRVATIVPGDAGYAVATFDRLYPIPPRRSLVQLGERIFRVVGPSGTSLWLYPNVGETLQGEAIIVAVDRIPVQYFERSFTGASTQLTTAQRAGSPVLITKGLDGFPDRGMVVLRPTGGGSIEVEYYGRDRFQLFNLIWPEKMWSLIRTNGILSPTLANDMVVESVLEFKESILDPAFAALVRRRVAWDSGSPNGQANISDSNADQYYRLLKNSIAVLRTTASAPVPQLTDAFEDTLPAGVSLYVDNRQVIGDAVSATVEDQTLVCGWMVLDFTFVAPGGVLVAGVLTLPSHTVECTVAIAVTDPDAPSGHTFLWTLDVVRGSTSDLVVTDPTGQSTRITGLVAGGEYMAHVTVTSPSKQSRTVTLTIRT